MSVKRRKPGQFRAPARLKNVTPQLQAALQKEVARLNGEICDRKQSETGTGV